MNENVRVTCLIPFYNEGQRLVNTLEVVTKITALAEVICVDDGSTDSVAQQIPTQFPTIKLLQLAENQGKSAAIRHGVEFVQTPFVLLLDADLKDIVPEELEQAIDALQRQPYSIDMIILRRINADWYVKFDRGDVLFSGERILRTSDLKTILQQNVEHYQLEIAINAYMQERRKNVFWMPWSARNTYKMQKIGWRQGIQKELQMFSSIIEWKGLPTLAKQVFTFGRKRLPSEPMPVFAQQQMFF